MTLPLLLRSRNGKLQQEQTSRNLEPAFKMSLVIVANPKL